MRVTPWSSVAPSFLDQHRLGNRGPPRSASTPISVSTRMARAGLLGISLTVADLADAALLDADIAGVVGLALTGDCARRRAA